MQQSLKSIFNTYNKLSNIGKLFIFTCIFLIIIVFFKNVLPKKEGFGMQNDKIVMKTNADLYDDFYASIYDSLVFNEHKNSFEIDEIVKLISPSRKTRILDVGCGTGHHTGAINKQLDVAKSFIKNETMQIIGIDSSQAMINEARSKYPSAHFKVGDAMNPKIFDLNQFTDILCMYFTIYYFQNKRHFFDNCMDWLLPGGCLFLHLVDRENFDPILPPGNPLYIVSPQKYAKQRITNTNINFDDFNYKCNFKLENDIANFEEKIKFKNGNTRVNKHQLYMEDTEKILLYAQQAGFTLHSIIDLINVGYEYQFVYVFTKP